MKNIVCMTCAWLFCVCSAYAAPPSVNSTEDPGGETKVVATKPLVATVSEMDVLRSYLDRLNLQIDIAKAEATLKDARSGKKSKGAQVGLPTGQAIVGMPTPMINLGNDEPLASPTPSVVTIYGLGKTLGATLSINGATMSVTEGSRITGGHIARIRTDSVTAVIDKKEQVLPWGLQPTVQSGPLIKGLTPPGNSPLGGSYP